MSHFLLLYIPVKRGASSVDAPAGNHDSCIHHLGLDICFDEHNYSNSLPACLIERIGHWHKQTSKQTKANEGNTKSVLSSLSQSSGAMTLPRLACF